MRHIERLNIPGILERNHLKWQSELDAKRMVNPKARPDSSKYAHKEVRNQLLSMSHNKCFYCEGSVTDRPKEVDHYVEVAADPSKSFDWNNLYMACQNCNDKVPHTRIPVSEALDPCSDSDEEIKSNISFDREIVFPVMNSTKGRNTIKKFRLDTDLLNSQRRNWIIKIDNVIIDILENMIKENRKHLNEEELSTLMKFMNQTSPFSLMSEIYIRKRLRGFIP